MKKLFILLAIVLLCSCNPVGSGKPYYITGKTKPDNCICLFQYKDGLGNWIDFQDSCGLYHIGDTIR